MTLAVAKVECPIARTSTKEVSTLKIIRNWSRNNAQAMTLPLTVSGVKNCSDKISTDPE